MPVHDAVTLGYVNLYQATAARAHLALTGLGRIHGAMRGAHQPVACAVKKTVGLVIHLYRDMGATVQVGVHLSCIANGKSTARLTAILHVKRNGFATVEQID